uniref:phage tail tape measure protein n=1 Tax=Cellvibrio fontiphilus TaxID=1815559 RepID=UPI002B4BDF56|nr:phage tail tape measure protein [Cellvibrio fontiphilus]
MSSRELQLKIVLDAIDKASRILKTTTRAQQDLTNALKAAQQQKKQLDTVQKNVSSYLKVKSALDNNSKALADAREKVRAMALAQKNGQEINAAWRKEFTKANEAVRDLTLKTRNLRTELVSNRKQLKEAGFDTAKFADSQKKLASEAGKAAANLMKQKENLAALNRQQQRTRQIQESLQKLQTTGVKTAVIGAGAAYAGQAALSKGASVLGPGVGFEAVLRDMAITGNLSRTEEGALGQQIRIDAEKFGQFTDQISAGLSVLVANGITQAKELKYYSAILAKSSVATNSEMGDLGNLIISLRKNLNVAVGDIGASLDTLAYAGKEGSFEIKDMAKWLPQLSPMMAALGSNGLGAVSELGAALQIARLGAGTSDEAANNLKNYLSKITAPDTIKNFDDAGIDLKARLTELSTKGISPLQGSLQLISEYMKTKGADALKQFDSAMKITNDVERQAALEQLSSAFALGDLFRDMQAMSFIRPAIANSQQMQQIRTGSMAATGMIDVDWQKRMETTQKQLDQFQISVDELKLEAASILLPTVNEQLPGLIKFIRGIGQWMKQNPELTAGIAKWGAILLVGITTLGVFGFALGNSMVAISALTKLALGLGGPLKIVGSVLLWLSRLLLMNPIGLLITAIAGGAYLIWKNWEPIKGWFSGLWSDVKAAFDQGIFGITTLLLDWSPFGLIYKGVVWGLEQMGIEVPAKFKTLGGAIVDGLLGGLFGGLDSLKTGIVNLGVNAIGWFKETLGIHSPSRVFAELGANTMQGYQLGLQGQENPTLQRMGLIAKQVTAAGTGMVMAGTVAATDSSMIKRPTATKSITGDAITIVIHPTPGMDERAIAAQIERVLQERDRLKQRQQRANLFDND